MHSNANLTETYRGTEQGHAQKTHRDVEHEQFFFKNPTPLNLVSSSV